MRIVSLCMNRPVTVLMAVLAVMVFGVVSYQNLQVDLLPDLQYPVINITTEYTGASAQEVDKELTVPLVEAVSSISGIKSVQSVSSEAHSEITVQFHWGTDTDFAALYVREKADDVKLPDGAERPSIMPVNPASMPIMTIAVSGKGSLYQIKNAAERILKPRLEQLEGVAVAAVNDDHGFPVAPVIIPDRQPLPCPLFNHSSFPAFMHYISCHAMIRYFNCHL